MVVCSENGKWSCGTGPTDAQSREDNISFQVAVKIGLGLVFHRLCLRFYALPRPIPNWLYKDMVGHTFA